VSYTRPITFEAGKFLRSCDICGIRFRANQLTRGPDGKFRCIRWCAEQTQLERDRISADSNKRREAPPPPFGVPYSFKDAHMEEAVLFNFLANVRVTDSGWPGGIRFGASPATLFRGKDQVTQGAYSALSAGETMRYLHGLIVENRRPTAWISRAKVKLAELADWTITQQQGFGVSPGSTKSNDIIYGMVALGSANPPLLDQASLGLGMLRAFQVLGTSSYLSSAQGFAHGLVTWQRLDLRTNGYTVTSNLGANRIAYGAWTNLASIGAAGVTLFFRANMLLGCEFLAALIAQSGDAIYGADTTVGGFLISAPQQLLSTTIAAQRAFWSVGAYDATLAKTLTGLSSTTPFDAFLPFMNNSSRSGSWEYASGGTGGTAITGSIIAQALRSLFAIEGFSAQVSSVWTWLMSFTSNPTFQPTTTSRGQDAPTVNSQNGTYNPKTSLTTTLQVRDPATLAATKINATGTYDLQCAGYLAPIQAAQDSGSLELAKDFVTTGRSLLQAFCGLGGQPAANTGISANITLWRADNAPVIGQMFRFNSSNTFQI